MAGVTGSKAFLVGKSSMLASLLWLPDFRTSVMALASL